MVASYGKLMMWFFLMTDALTFSAFLGAYGFQRFVHTDAWPVAEKVFTHFPFLHGDHPLLFVVQSLKQNAYDHSKYLCLPL